MISGGFDPPHIGHVRMIKEAAKIGHVIVALNSDAWLMRKKGYVFMPWEERAEMLKSISGVASVVSVRDEDGTVCEALICLIPDYFVNGGDRDKPDPREDEICRKLRIQQLFGVGGEKIRSSSELVRKHDNRQIAV